MSNPLLPIPHLHCSANLPDSFMLNALGPSLRPLVLRRISRKIPAQSERVLDAPGMVDDFYLNLLSWSCQNAVAVALDHLTDLFLNSSLDLVWQRKDIARTTRLLFKLFAGVSVIALIVVGLVTYERTKYRKVRLPLLSFVKV